MANPSKVVNIRSGPPLINERFGPLAGGREPPHDGGMEARITRLEEHLGTLREDVATIKERLSHTATKAWVMGGVIVVLVAVVGGFWWIAQQYLIPILQHAHP